LFLHHHRVLVLDAASLRAALPMPEAIAAVREGLAAAAREPVPAPQRLHLDLPAGTVLVMAAALPAAGVVAVKSIGVFPGNPGRGWPTSAALVILQDAATGEPLALLEGATLTALRTGALGGVAADALARPDAAVAALIGAGPQAEAQLEALAAVRGVRQVRIASRTGVSARQLAARLETVPWASALTVHVANRVEEAVRPADVVIVATTSAEPVLDAAWVAPGAHVTAVGAFRRHERELPGELVASARVIVDNLESCLAEAGDLLIPMNEGHFGPDHIAGELGEVLLGRVPGRRDTGEITLFKSVGNALLDAAAGAAALSRVREMAGVPSLRL
jgi:ornithine cyclodeaminase/alanine dehydrogenase-like protein (mu-crystallin family)